MFPLLQMPVPAIQGSRARYPRNTTFHLQGENILPMVHRAFC
jgi:hypothetical protein